MEAAAQKEAYADAKVQRLLERVRSGASTGTVELPNVYLRCSGVEALAAALLEGGGAAVLDLRGNDVRGRGARSLARVLVSERGGVRSLNLEWNLLGADGGRGAAELAAGVADSRTLSHLDLKNNRLGPEAGESLARGIARSASLSHVDLRWNSLGSSGARHIAAALRTNRSVTVCQLAGNGVSREVLADVAESLRRNHARLVASGASPADELPEPQPAVAGPGRGGHDAEKHRLALALERVHEGRGGVYRFLPHGARGRLRPSAEGGSAPSGPLGDGALLEMAHHALAKEAVDRHAAEVRSHAAYREGVELTVEGLRSERTSLREELRAAAARHETESHRRQEAECGRREAEALADAAEEERQRLQALLDGRAAVTERELRAMQNEMGRLTEELARAEAEGTERARVAEASLAHETAMRAADREAAAKSAEAAAEEARGRLHEAEEAGAARARSAESEVERLRAALAAAAGEVKASREAVLRQRVDHEEAYARFERALRDEQEQRVRVEMSSFEKRLAQLQESRDQAQQRAEHQAELHRRLAEDAKAEREAHAAWAAGECEARADAERRAADAELEQARLETAASAAERRADELAARVDALERQLAEAVAARQAEGRAAARAAQQHHEEAALLRAEASDAKLEAARLEEQHRQRVESLHNVLGGLQAALAAETKDGGAVLITLPDRTAAAAKEGKRRAQSPAASPKSAAGGSVAPSPATSPSHGLQRAAPAR